MLTYYFIIGITWWVSTFILDIIENEDDWVGGWRDEFIDAPLTATLIAIVCILVTGVEIALWPIKAIFYYAGKIIKKIEL